MGLSPEQRKARARDLCISEYGIDPEARITDNPELPPLPAADRIMWQHGQQIDHYSPVQMRAYAAEAVRVEHARLLDALEAAQKDAARLRKLVPIAAAQIGHRYEGDCPDELDRSRRDQGCPACALLLLAERESP